MIFLAILIFIVLENALWWRWSDRFVRTFPRVRPWRIAVAAFTCFEMLYVLVFMIIPLFIRHPHFLPMPIMVTMYIWNILILPVALILLGAIRFSQFLKSRRNPITQTSTQESQPAAITRRQWLTTAAITLPPLAATGLAARALAQLSTFRVRYIDVPIPNLPPPLDGLTIAHVSDIHVGKFTRPGILQKTIDATNNLRADLVLFTGDLIDFSLDDLPAGIDVMKKIDPRGGMLMIEGNHDLLDDPTEFEQSVIAAGLPILLDENRTLTVKGIPVQFLGIRWGRVEDTQRRHSNNQIIRDSVNHLLAQRDPNAFPILLAHHPHAFDTAIEAGIPLTISGHTHGGQLMLNERLGVGPVMFRYWSGLYQHGNSSLVVSNGVGNWFPLRINAPAEIIKITLRSQPATTPASPPAASRPPSPSLPQST